MISSGPIPAPMMIVGEAPGEDEMRSGHPFTGASGQELTRMLTDAGIPRGDCFICNVTDMRPPDNDISMFFANKTEAKRAGIAAVNGRYPLATIRIGLDQLEQVIPRVKPRVILALGDTALWGLTGNNGIGKWRGSELRHHSGVPVVPTWHPAAVLREWPLRPIAVHDMRRAVRVRDHGIPPNEWSFIVRPTFADVEAVAEAIRKCNSDGVKIVCDIETRRAQIACVGLATDQFHAICIPFMCIERPEGYWTEYEEIGIVQILHDVLTAPGAQLVFQNGAYDLQYFAKQWGFLPRVSDDTMLMQHTLFPGMRKALDFLASMYCEHYVFWKEDGKNWEPSMGEEQLWSYNCTDCVRTYEVMTTLDNLVDSMGMREHYKLQMRLFHQVVRMMLRGIRIDAARKMGVVQDLNLAQEQTKAWIAKAVGRELNPRSHPQMRELFLEEFAVKPVISRKTHGPTFDDESLQTIARRQPLLRPLTDKIEEYRSIGVFKSTFAEAKASEDGRMRCSINLAGARTFRFATAEDAFGSGMNMQNLPKGTED